MIIFMNAFLGCLPSVLMIARQAVDKSVYMEFVRGLTPPEPSSCCSLTNLSPHKVYPYGRYNQFLEIFKQIWPCIIFACSCIVMLGVRIGVYNFFMFQITKGDKEFIIHIFSFKYKLFLSYGLLNDNCGHILYSRIDFHASYTGN